jgi:hypothetical protein
LVARAGTLLIPSGPSHNPNKMHLHVVCTDPCSNGNQLIVCICTWTSDLCDDACILQPGEHRFLTRKSYVLYRKSRIESAAALDNGIAIGLFRSEPQMNAQSFLRIKNGICRSKQTPRKMKTYFGCT